MWKDSRQNITPLSQSKSVRLHSGTLNLVTNKILKFWRTNLWVINYKKMWNQKCSETSSENLWMSFSIHNRFILFNIFSDILNLTFFFTCTINSNKLFHFLYFINDYISLRIYLTTVTFPLILTTKNIESQIFTEK